MLKYLQAILSVCLFFAGPFVLAQEQPQGNDKLTAFGTLAAKVDARLIPAVTAARAGAKDLDVAVDLKRSHGRALAKTSKMEQLVVRIDALVTEELLEQIRATGAVINHSVPRWNTVSLRATVSQIDALSKIEAVRFITLQAGRRLRSTPGQQGICPNQAFAVMNVNKLPSSVTGTGQTVGVISDSVDETTAVNGSPLFSSVGTAPNITVSGMIPQNTGDLPATIQVVDPGLPDDISTDTDEGEAILELIHDIAPGAGLAFGAADDTQPEMANNLLLLRTAANCTVTADDIGFIDEPYFQDGPIAQAITTNYNAGVPHFSAFGNDNSNGILATFTPMNSSKDDMKWNPPSGKCFHNWGIGGTHPSFLPISLPPGDELVVMLQWNQPFSSYGLGSGSQADLDLYLYASEKIVPNNAALATSLNPQGGPDTLGGDPVEILDYVNKTNSTTIVYLCLNHYQGVRDNVMRLLFEDTGGYNGNFMGFPSGGVNNMTGYGHPTSFNCVGVGAMYFDSQNVNGNLQAESFSSQGGGFGFPGIPYYFDATGNLLPNAPVLRNGPDFLAPDGCTTSVFDIGDGYIGGFPQFYGTSCAAPNAAAVAALLLSAPQAPDIATLISTLKETANKNTSPISPNVFTGNGLIDANAAYQTLFSQTITFASGLSATPNPAGVGQTVSFSAVATEAGNPTLSYSWDFGDGVMASGATATHAYGTAGAFSATLFVTDPTGGVAVRALTVTVAAPQVGEGDDSNGLGFSDSFDIAAGINPLDPTASPLGGAPASSVTPQLLTAQKLQIKLNFTPGKDAISFSGTLPIPSGFNAFNQKVTLDISGVDAGFTLNSKGLSQQMILDVSGPGFTSSPTGLSGATGSFSLKFKSQRGVVAEQQAKYAVKLSKGNFAASLSSFAGLTQNTQINTPVNIVITVLFNGVVYQSIQPLKYTVHGSTGTAK